MKKRILIGAGLIALAAILASVPYAFAQRGMAGHGRAGHDDMMAFGRLSKLQSELGLNDQQVADIKATFQAVREQNAPYRAQLHAGMKQIAQTLIANPNDLAAAQTLLDQQTAAETAMKQNALAAMAKALQVLTPEQRTKLQGVVNERIQKMESRHGLLR
jgi:Spy/CpxP family protein refolding chaperone